jgi:hypothetical protein
MAGFGNLIMMMIGGSRAEGKVVILISFLSLMLFLAVFLLHILFFLYMICMMRNATCMKGLFLAIVTIFAFPNGLSRVPVTGIEEPSRLRRLVQRNVDHESHHVNTCMPRHTPNIESSESLDRFELGGIFVPVYPQYSYNEQEKHLIKANPTIIARTLTLARLVHTLVIFSSRTSSSTIRQRPDAVLLVDFPRLREQELDGMRVLLGDFHNLALQTRDSTLDQPSDFSVLALAPLELTAMLAEQGLDPAQVELEVRRGVCFLRDEAEEALEVDDRDVADEQVDVGGRHGAVDAREQLCV